ncbi:ABC transporter ATP-binding protein [Frondihabitans peucedani]|uniref:ABC transporter ATP-binding protein n=1 Tax=Frondihabitans peucedani TaxID=598626 RepID=A0ABP8E0G2_9MICO
MTLQTTAPETRAAAAPALAPGLAITGLTKELGGRTIVDSFDLVLERGELVALLGPSGCGKTTTLRMIAGFLEPDAGTVEIEGRDVTDLGPEKRPSAMVFQNYALWPHLTVFKNVAFPLTLKRLSKAEISARVMTALETVGLTHHAESRPAHISGGEQQRAALARAIVQEPGLLLLDEPLSNLDAKLRVRVREEIREIQQRLGITTVMVTHDQEEALAISDRVAVMNAGRIEQVGAPADLYANPATTFVASFIGSMNWLAGPTVAAARAGAAAAAAADRAAESWAVRPEDVRFEAVPDGEATILRVLPHGHFSELVIDVAGLELRAVASGAGPRSGDRGRVLLDNVRHYRDGLLAGRVEDAR